MFATDVMTTLLSPSTIKSLNPASTTNYKAFRQANMSASSLSITGGPLAEIDAITSPLPFRIIAPNPEACSS